VHYCFYIICCSFDGMPDMEVELAAPPAELIRMRKSLPAPLLVVGARAAQGKSGGALCI
jgi:hypothetical protein